MKLPILFATLSLVLAGAASAQSVPHQGACRADAQKLCGTEVKTRDKAKVQACLAANASKVTPDCRANLMAAKDAKAAQ